jgi:putative tryptophan/tyrosine transport system substrate-binding protein
MRRREFIAGLGGLGATWSRVARAQRPAMPVVGYLASSTLVPPFVTAFRRGLGELGYVEGTNVTIEYQSADGRFERLPALAADFVRRGVAVIVAPDGGGAANAAKAATESIPILFIVGGDPVSVGLVASLARPGGNVTGLAVLAGGLMGKRLKLLHRVVPAANSIALLVNPANSVAQRQGAEAQMSARLLGVDLLILEARNKDEIEKAFVNLARKRAGALLVSADPLFRTQNEQIVALAAQFAIPTSYESAISTAAGGLMSYGTDLADVSRQLGVYTGRILRGEKPSELPVMQPTKFELVINLKTAKALGLTIPETLLATADEVIQ